MMRITQKDRVFLALLPTVAAVAGYVFFVARPVDAEAARFDKRRLALGSERDIAARRDRLAEEQKGLRESLKALEDAPPEAKATDSASRLKRLQEGARAAGVRLLSVRQDAGPNAVRPAAGAAQAQAWTVTVEAPYEAVGRLLDEFSRVTPPIVPEALSMRPGAGEGKPNYWMITLCL